MSSRLGFAEPLAKCKVVRTPPLGPRQAPKPRRLPREKAVTIGVGFSCIDGIVLCADTQITFPGSHKYYESKIYSYYPPRWSIGFTFAGSPGLMKSFWGKFQSESNLMMQHIQPSVAAIQSVLEDVLAGMDTVATDTDGLYMLCGIVVPGSGTALLQTNRQVVHTATDLDYIGIGDSSLLRFLKPLFSSPVFTTKQALVLGTYFVSRAKAYIEGCGGDTDALVMRSDGKVELKDAKITSPIEQRLIGLEKGLSGTIALLFNETSDGDGVEDELHRFAKTLAEENRQFDAETRR